MEETRQCCECGQNFAPDDMITYGDLHVCGQCKPYFFQKVREGLELSSGLNFATFGVRFGAWFIDSIILAMVSLMVIALFVIPFFAFGIVNENLLTESEDEFAIGFMIFYLVLNLFTFALQITYKTYFVGRFQATPGKMMLGLKVVAGDGSRISYMKAFARYWAEMVSGFTMYIGYLLALFDAEKRALHDMMCDTRVVRA